MPANDSTELAADSAAVDAAKHATHESAILPTNDAAFGNSIYAAVLYAFGAACFGAHHAAELNPFPTTVPKTHNPTKHSTNTATDLTADDSTL